MSKESGGGRMTRTKRGMIDSEMVVEIIATTSIILIGGALIFGVIWACIGNEKNRITEGVIVDKSYSEAYTTTDCKVINNNTITEVHYHPACYRFKLQGEKDEITVTYWLSVSEKDYNEYKIGDYYKL